MVDTTPPAEVSIEHHFADVNRVRLHYASAGHGKLVLFLHGFPEFWYAWQRQLLEFGRDHWAVAPDLRGYNLSSKPDELKEYRLGRLLEDVRGLAEHLGHETFVLVGHDWGGLIAWIFAAKYPQYVAKLVIANAPHPAVFERELRDSPQQQYASSYFGLFARPDAEAVLTANNFAFLARATLDEGFRLGYRVEEDRQKYLNSWSQPGAITAAINYYRANRLRVPSMGDGFWSIQDSIPELTSTVISVPTLVLWGLKDWALPPGNLDGLQQFVPKLRLRTFADTGHWVIAAKSNEVNRLIREFLRE